MDTNRTIVGDVGGTNCRLASCDVNRTSQGLRGIPVKDFHSLGEVIQVFKRSRSSATFTRASIAIANPIMGDIITMTNSHWTFSIEETREVVGWMSCSCSMTGRLSRWPYPT